MDFINLISLLELNFSYIDLGSHKQVVIDTLGQPDGIYSQKKHNVIIFKYRNIQLTFLDDFLYSYNIDFKSTTPAHSLSSLNNLALSSESYIVEEMSLHKKITLKNGIIFIFGKDDILENIFFCEEEE